MGDGDWSAEDVRQLIENFKAKNPKAKLMCNQPLHKVVKDRGTCKLFATWPSRAEEDSPQSNSDVKISAFCLFCSNEVIQFRMVVYAASLCSECE